MNATNRFRSGRGGEGGMSSPFKETIARGIVKGAGLLNSNE